MTTLFRSPLSPRLQAFLEMRRLLGRSPAAYVKILRYLDNFLVAELKAGETITRDVAERWISGMRHLGIGTRINRISVLRQFCLYLSHFDQRTCIVPSRCTPRRVRPAPHIYSPGEVRALINAARKVGPPRTLRPALMATLIGLLYATGLRISEALKLTLADVDIPRKILVIRMTKFKKSRYVPLSSSAAQAMAAFLRRRASAGFSTAPESCVFVSARSGRAYGAPGIYTLFLQMARRLKIRGPIGVKGARLHDFRHTFAVQRLLTWYREGAVLQAKLPLLSTYLGHNTVTYTEVYLQATAELLEEANKRFHRGCAIPDLNDIHKEESHVS